MKKQGRFTHDYWKLILGGLFLLLFIISHV